MAPGGVPGPRRWALVAGFAALGSVACSRGEDLPDAPRPTASALPVPSAAVGARLDLPPPTAPSVAVPASPPEPTASPGLGPAPATREGGLVVSNPGLPREVVSRIVRQNFARMRLCYQRASASDPTLEGSVVVQFVIEPDGSVGSAALSPGTTLGDAEAAACIVRAFRRLSFPEPSSGALAATYTIYFTPASPPSSPTPPPPPTPPGAR